MSVREGMACNYAGETSFVTYRSEIKSSFFFCFFNRQLYSYVFKMEYGSSTITGEKRLQSFFPFHPPLPPRNTPSHTHTHTPPPPPPLPPPPPPPPPPPTTTTTTAVTTTLGQVSKRLSVSKQYFFRPLLRAGIFNDRRFC